MKLKISAYDKDDNLLFSRFDFDGDVFYEKIPCRISDNLGFTWMSQSLDYNKKRRLVLDRRVCNDLKCVVKMTMQDKTIFSGNSYIRDIVQLLSGLDYGNLPEINEYINNNMNLIRNAEKLIFEKINI